MDFRQQLNRQQQHKYALHEQKYLQYEQRDFPRPPRTSCTGCRLRRRKCDRKRPICTDCYKLNIPQELCTFHSNVGIIDKNVSVTLEMLRKRNRALTRSQIDTKHVYEECLEPLLNYRIQQSKYNASINDDTNDPLDFILKEKFETESRFGYAGRIGWTAIATTNQKAWFFTRDLRSTIDQAKSIYNKTTDTLSKEADKLVLYQQIKDEITLILLGIKELNIKIFIHLLNLILKSLPNYSIIQLTLAKFFQFNSSRLVQLDEHSFLKNFQKWFSLNKSNGLIQLNIKLNETVTNDESLKQRFDIFANLSALLCILSSRMLFQQLSKPGNTSFNFMLFLRYAELLIDLTFSFKQLKNSLPELFQASLFIQYFYEFLPYGERDGTDGTSLRKRLETSLNIFKMSYDFDKIDINENDIIDVSKFNPSLRSSIEFLVLSDILESFELGIPSIINSVDLKKFERIIRTNFKSESVVNMVLCFYKILNKYFKHESILTPKEFVYFVENDLIFELQSTFYLNFNSIETILNEFKRFNPENDDSQFGYEDFNTNPLNSALIIYKCCLTLLYVTIIQVFYETILRKITRFQHLFNQETVERDIKKFKILSVKYSYLIYLLNIEILQTFKEFLNNNFNSLSFYPNDLIYFLYTFITISIKRAGVSLVIVICQEEDFDFDELSKFKSSNDLSYNFENPTVDHKLISALLPEFPTIKELQHREIDRDTDLLVSKYENLMLNGKNSMLIVYKFVIDYMEAIKNKKLDLRFLKDNYNFYQTVVTLFLAINFKFQKENETKSTEQKTPTIKEEEYTASQEVLVDEADKIKQEHELPDLPNLENIMADCDDIDVSNNSNSNDNHTKESSENLESKNDFLFGSGFDFNLETIFNSTTGNRLVDAESIPNDFDPQVTGFPLEDLASSSHPNSNSFEEYYRDFMAKNFFTDHHDSLLPDHHA